MGNIASLSEVIGPNVAVGRRYSWWTTPSTLWPMTFAEFQALIERTYGERDRARGQAATVAWLAEETGELAKAARKGTRAEQLHELGDVIAWVTSLASQLGLSMEEAIDRYADGCPRCGTSPCSCP